MLYYLECKDTKKNYMQIKCYINVKMLFCYICVN